MAEADPEGAAAERLKTIRRSAVAGNAKWRLKLKASAGADPEGDAAERLKAVRDDSKARCQKKWRLKRKELAADFAAAAARLEGGTDAGSLSVYSPMPLNTNIEALLEEAATGKGYSVSTVLTHTLPLALRWLKARGYLGPDFPEPMEHVFRAAGEACRRLVVYNSVGKTPRTILEKAGVTFEHIMRLIPIVAALWVTGRGRTRSRGMPLLAATRGTRTSSHSVSGWWS